MTATAEIPTTAIEVGMPDAEQSEATPSYVNWRKAMDASGVTVQAMRERIDSYIYGLPPVKQRVTGALAERVLRWYSEGLTTTEAAKLEQIGVPQMSRGIRTIAHIALNPTLDIAEFVGGGVIETASGTESDQRAVEAVALQEVLKSDAIESSRTRRHNWRFEIETAGVTTETIRVRLNTYLARNHGSRNFRVMVASTQRFLRWHESGATPKEAAISEDVSEGGMTQLIQRLSRVVLDSGYDSEEVVFDWIAESAETTRVPRAEKVEPDQSVEGKPQVNMGAAARGPRPSPPPPTKPKGGFRPSISDDWFGLTKPVQLGIPVPRDRYERADEDNPLAWQTDALCSQTDPEAFFPEKGGSTRDAKKICAGCEVKAQCLEYALTNDERFGIWGGLSERERRRLRRSRIR